MFETRTQDKALVVFFFNAHVYQCMLYARKPVLIGIHGMAALKTLVT